MAGEGVDGIDLYADVDDFGPDADYHDADIYEDMMTSRSGDSFDDVRLSNQILRQSSFNGKKFALFVANLTWWTTDNDLLEAMNNLGVLDVIEIRFHENRVNGQSKGFATVVVGSENSSKILLEKLSKRDIHGQQVLVTHCTTSAHKQFDTSSKKESVVPNGGQRLRVPPPVGGGVITRPLQAPPSLGQLAAPPPASQIMQQQQQQQQHQQQHQHSLLGPASAIHNQTRLLLPPGTNTALPPPALPQFQQQGLRHFPGGIQTLQSNNHLGASFQIIQGQPPPGVQIIGGPPRLQASNPPPALMRGPPVVGLRLSAGGMEIREGFQQPPPNFTTMRPPLGQMVVQQHPPPMLASQLAHPGMVAVPQGQQQQHIGQQHIGQQQQLHHHHQQPGSMVTHHSLNPHVNPAFLSVPGSGGQQQQHAVVTSVAQMAVDEYGRPMTSFQGPGVAFAFNNQQKNANPNDSFQTRGGPNYSSSNESYRERDRRTQASTPPPRERHDSSMSSQVSDMEFEEILQRNKTVSSSAISRAVQDASVGEYASAIETLVTAISLIKQSKIASDDRCKILICSLRDTLEGIESKSYGSKSSRDRRSRSPRERTSEKHSSSSSSARHRSRSRDYREGRGSRDKDRHHDVKTEREYHKESRGYDKERDYREGRSGRH